jgi:mannosyltransferase
VTSAKTIDDVVCTRMTTPATARAPLVLDCTIFGLQRFGGISNYWSQLVQAMRGYDGPVHLVVPSKVRYQGVGTAGFPESQLRHERLPTEISRYLPCHSDADSVFHTSYYRLPNRRVGRYVVTAYDFIYERYRGGLAKQIHHRQKRASLMRADAVICISECTRSDVLRFCPEVDPSRLRVVPLGIDQWSFQREAPGSPSSDSRLVLFVGQRDGYKRFDLAVEALTHMPSLTLGVVGGVLRDDEVAVLRRLLGDRWTDFGQVSAERLRQLYAASFAFIFPSDYEGFGLPVLEAMACGCPVVASVKGSLPEVGGGAAIYAIEQRAESYAMALASLVDPETRGQYVARGLLRCTEFSWERTFALTQAIYLGTDRADAPKAPGLSS